jgi:hypothetical protein
MTSFNIAYMINNYCCIYFNSGIGLALGIGLSRIFVHECIKQGAVIVSAKKLDFRFHQIYFYLYYCDSV